MAVAGSGQVDSGVLDDWVWGYIPRVGQLPTICVLRGPLGSTKKDEFVCFYYCIKRIAIMIIDYWSRDHSITIISLV